MKKTFLTLVCLLTAAGAARAQQQVFLKISSVTLRTVSVSTTAATRVDNFNGLFEGVLYGRNEIFVTNWSANATINCGYDNQVSSPTASVTLKVGSELTAGSKRDVALPANLAYWCISQAAAGPQKITVEQARYMTPQPTH